MSQHRFTEADDAARRATHAVGEPVIRHQRSAAASSIGVRYQRRSMAEKKSNPGHQLIALSVFIFWIASDMGIWQLFVVAGFMLVLGILVTVGYAMKNQQSISQQTAQGLNPLLPTSKGVAWLEFATKYMDNPDTAVQPIGAQLEGTHPSLEGVSGAEFGSAYGSGKYASSMSEKEFNIGFRGQEFADSGIAQFVEHTHSSPVPRSWHDPVSEWYDPVSAWYDPFG